MWEEFNTLITIIKLILPLIYLCLSVWFRSTGIFIHWSILTFNWIDSSTYLSICIIRLHPLLSYLLSTYNNVASSTKLSVYVYNYVAFSTKYLCLTIITLHPLLIYLSMPIIRLHHLLNYLWMPIIRLRSLLSYLLSA